MSDRKTKFAYEVVVFTTPNYDRDLTVKVNENVNRVRAWAEHLGPVRIVSLSNSKTATYSGQITLTIEYTAYDDSAPE